jgi:serine/threonine protein kinase
MLFQGQILGKYKIPSPLGSGGFGTVYLARDTWIDKQVAIKVPHRQNLDFGDLLREPRLLASVSHPNIVAITTAEKQDGVFFIVMEYVPGRDARDDRAARGRASISPGRSTTPARSATRSTTRTARACCTATCGRPTCSSRTPASPRSPTSAPRASSKSPRTERR